jgi:N-acetylglucosaminyldiphosphoundecaprenol N-acetyl-beta-D-mannosaminyltransferase
MLQAMNVLGVKVNAVNMESTMAIAGQWIRERTPGYICLRDIHGIMRCRDDAVLRQVHNRADLVAPDGMPLVWLARLLGVHDVGRVCGIDLLPALCARSVETGWRHFFCGGAPGVAERLAANLSRLNPGMVVAGTLSPPYRELSPAEDQGLVDAINAARPDIVWVGLGTPKQEHWMAQHVGRLTAPVMVGVGAAFDIHAGLIRRAPFWMQRAGLEWFFRLLVEPRRLWRRYLTSIPPFVALALLQLAGVRKYSFDDAEPLVDVQPERVPR